MSHTTYIDDEVIENDNVYYNIQTDNIQSDNVKSDNIQTDNVKSDNTDDDDTPPASGMMMLAEPPGYPSTSISALSYTSERVLSILSWIGSGLYSLTNAFGNTVTPEEQHMHILNTIAKLNNHLVFLDKKIESMNRNSTRFSEQAKQLYKFKKIPSAMHQIRLKKMYDCEIAKLEKLKFNIETNILHMDSVEIMLVTVDTIKDTSEHFQKINGTLNIEKLEDTIDELVEHRDAAIDIQTVLSDMQLFNEANYDEDDLMKELEIMSKEADSKEADSKDAKEAKQSIICYEDFPDAPSSALPSSMQTSDTELNNIEITDNNLELSAVF